MKPATPVTTAFTLRLPTSSGQLYCRRPQMPGRKVRMEKSLATRPESKKRLEGPHGPGGGRALGRAPVAVVRALEEARLDQTLQSPPQHGVVRIDTLQLHEGHASPGTARELDQAAHAHGVVRHVEDLVVGGEESPVDEEAARPGEGVAGGDEQPRQIGGVVG